MIEVQNLTKFYGPTRSIDDVSFSVSQGEVLGFLGPNGAGKSTTMRLITGLARPTNGTARIGGFDVQKQHEDVRRMIGYLPEAAPLYGDMTLASYLEFMGGIKGLDGRKARTEMERATELVNLKAERKRLLRNLSKGTRQRAALAQALLGDPPVLLLDEPTVGLDPSQINDVRVLIKSLAGHRTVVFSTHILPEVEMTCTRIVIIANGKIVAKGTPRELVSSEEPEYLVVVRGDREKLEKVLSDLFKRQVEVRVEGTTLEARVKPGRGEDNRALLSRGIVESGLELLELRSSQARLEDVFLRAIGKGE